MLRAGELLEQHEVRLDRVGALAVADVLEPCSLRERKAEAPNFGVGALGALGCVRGALGVR